MASCCAQGVKEVCEKRLPAGGVGLSNATARPQPSFFVTETELLVPSALESHQLGGWRRWQGSHLPSACITQQLQSSTAGLPGAGPSLEPCSATCKRYSSQSQPLKASLRCLGASSSLKDPHVERSVSTSQLRSPHLCFRSQRSRGSGYSRGCGDQTRQRRTDG